MLVWGEGYIFWYEGRCVDIGLGGEGVVVGMGEMM